MNRLLIGSVVGTLVVAASRGFSKFANQPVKTEKGKCGSHLVVLKSG